MTTSRLYASKKFMGALLLMMGFVLPANAQFLRTSYFMEGTHYRRQLNPALIPTQGYFGIGQCYCRVHFIGLSGYYRHY